MRILTILGVILLFLSIVFMLASVGGSFVALMVPLGSLLVGIGVITGY